MGKVHAAPPRLPKYGHGGKPAPRDAEAPPERPEKVDKMLEIVAQVSSKSRLDVVRPSSPVDLLKPVNKVPLERPKALEELTNPYKPLLD